MGSSLPVVPADVLDIENPLLVAAISQELAREKLSSQIKYPRKDAATLIEEMTFDDMVDWACKSVKPITTMEEGILPEEILVRDNGIAGLPTDFKKISSVNLGAAGDLLYSPGLVNSKNILFENINDILFEQDVSYANFESPVTKHDLIEEIISDRAAPIECCSPEQFSILTSHHGKYLNVLNTANNHILDMGLEGMDTTWQILSENNLLNTGTNQSVNDCGKGRFLTVNGIKLGFAACTFGLNGHQLPEGQNYRINVANLLSKHAEPDLKSVKEQIDHCKEQQCDFIITSMHWGFEFEFFPRLRQIKAAHELVEYGSDAIISHHPHVIQPVEYYRTKRDNSRVATIAYSLGSLTWNFTAPHLALSAIQNLTLAKGDFDGHKRTYIETARITPVFRDVVEENGKLITKIQKLDGYVDQQNNRSDYFEKMKQYVDLVLGG